MPFIFDFDRCVPGSVRTVEVSPKGWRTPLFVEYGLAQAHEYDTQISVVWRVKGTTHVFTIYEQRLNLISHADYKKHFEDALAGFREDYLSWFTDRGYDQAAWKYDYRDLYGRLIIPDGDEGEDNEDKGL